MAARIHFRKRTALVSITLSPLMALSAFGIKLKLLKEACISLYKSVPVNIPPHCPFASEPGSLASLNCLQCVECTAVWLPAIVRDLPLLFSLNQFIFIFCLCLIFQFKCHFIYYLFIKHDCHWGSKDESTWSLLLGSFQSVGDRYENS